MNSRQTATLVACLGVFFWLLPLPCASAPETHYAAQVWQTEDGLPNNAVQAVCQTSDGFLWIGTQNGLARFDGYKFHAIALPGSTNVRTSVINALIVARDGGLWIGSAAGQLTHWRNGEIKMFSCEDGVGNTILSLYEDDGFLWVGTRDGMRTFRNGKFTRFSGPYGIRTAPIRSFTHDHTNGIWTAYSGGIGQISAKGVVTNYNASNGLKNFFARAIYGDPNGDIWAGSNEGVVLLSEQRFTFYSKKHGLPDNVVNAIYKDSNGTLWMGTHSGLCRFVDGKFVPELNEKGDSFDQVFCFVEDREGSLWVGAKDGLYRLNRRQFESYTTRHGLAHNNILSVMEDRKGQLWVGTWGGGLHQLQDDGWTIHNRAVSRGSDHVLALCEGRDGSIWFGSDFDGNLCRLKNGKVTRYRDEKIRFGTEAIRAIHEDEEGRLWIGARNGLFLMEEKTVRRFADTNGLPNLNVRCLAPDGKGGIWIGTEGGLAFWKSGVFRTFTTSDGLADSMVLALYHDAEANLWIGTARGGLARLTDGRFLQCSTRDGLFSDDVLEFLEDDDGRLWMASSRGVFHVEKKELDDFFRGLVSSVKCVSYGRADGMVSSVCVGAAKPSACRTRDGRFWFATTKGLAVTNPKLHIEKNNVAPPVAIKEIIADQKLVECLVSNASGQNGGTAMNSASPVSLPPGRGEIEFHYATLSFRAPEKNQHKFMLEGVDREWVDAGNRRVAYYNNLAPGTYTFRVIGSNNDQVWNEWGTSVTITLQPHFRQTWWFAASVTSVCLGAAGGAARYITRRRMQRKLQRLEQQHALERERHRIARDIHDDVGASLTQIGLLSEMVRRDIGETDKAVAHTAKISETAGELVLAMDEIVWAVNPRNDNLRRMAAYIFKFAEEFLTVSGVRCRIQQSETLLEIPLTAETRHNVFLVVKEALNNVVKHARATEVWLRLKIDRQELELIIEDNGCGFGVSAPDAFGNGLLNMKKRMEDIGGRFEQSSAAGKGTQTRLYIVLK